MTTPAPTTRRPRQQILLDDSGNHQSPPAEPKPRPYVPDITDRPRRSLDDEPIVAPPPATPSTKTKHIDPPYAGFEVDPLPTPGLGSPIPEGYLTGPAPTPYVPDPSEGPYGLTPDSPEPPTRSPFFITPSPKPAPKRRTAPLIAVILVALAVIGLVAAVSSGVVQLF